MSIAAGSTLTLTVTHRKTPGDIDSALKFTKFIALMLLVCPLAFHYLSFNTIDFLFAVGQKISPQCALLMIRI